METRQFKMELMFSFVMRKLDRKTTSIMLQEDKLTRSIASLSSGVTDTACGMAAPASCPRIFLKY